MADWLDPVDLGAEGDGESHPLYMYYSTLAAAQSAFPQAGVSSLNQEKNWAAIQSALNMVKNSAGSWYGVRLSPGLYEMGASTLALDNASRSVILEGAGDNTTAMLRWTGTPAGGACLDITNTSRCTFRNFQIIGQGSGVDIGILLARTDRDAAQQAVNGSCCHNLFENVMLQGTFNKAGVYALNAENNTFQNCVIWNDKAANASYAFYGTSDNDLSAATVAPGSFLQSNVGTSTNNRIVGGAVAHWGTGVALGLAGNNTAWDISTYLYSEHRAVAILNSNGSNKFPYALNFRACALEGQCTMFYLDADNIYNLVVEGCNMYGVSPDDGYLVYQSDGNYLYNLRWRNNSLNVAGTYTGNGKMRLDRVLYSDVEADAVVNFYSERNRWWDCTPTFGTIKRGDMLLGSNGLVLPMYTPTERGNISTPTTGMVIYDTVNNKLNFYSGSAWEVVTSA